MSRVNGYLLIPFYTPERLEHPVLSRRKEADYAYRRDELKKSISTFDELGDQKSLDSARAEYTNLSNLFMSHNYRLTFDLFRKFRGIFPETEHEPLNSVILGKAFDLWHIYFDPKKGRFSTLAYKSIPRQVLFFKKSILKMRKISSFSEHDFYETDNLRGEGNVLSSFSNSHSPLENVLQLEKVERLLNILESSEILSEKEKKVLTYRFGLYSNMPLNLEEIGKMIGLTRERVRQIENAALKKLRLAF